MYRTHRNQMMPVRHRATLAAAAGVRHQRPVDIEEHRSTRHRRTLHSALDVGRQLDVIGACPVWSRSARASHRAAAVMLSPCNDSPAFAALKRTIRAGIVTEWSLLKSTTIPPSISVSDVIRHPAAVSAVRTRSAEYAD